MKDEWSVDDVLLPHEQLDVYHVAGELIAFTEEIHPNFPGRHRRLEDQLVRAADSIAEALSEGAGSFYPKEKRQYYSRARGSVAECVAILQTCHQRGILSDKEHLEGRRLGVRIYQMLTRLVLAQDSRIEADDGPSNIADET